MAKKKENKELEEQFEQAETTVAQGPTVESTLKDAANKDYRQVIVIGLFPDAKMEIMSSLPNLSFIHHMLNRSVFEMNTFEMSNIAEKTRRQVAANED